MSILKSQLCNVCGLQYWKIYYDPIVDINKIINKPINIDQSLLFIFNTACLAGMQQIPIV